MVNRTEATVTLDAVCYTLSAIIILYILARHVLLLKGKLKPEALACGDCTKATYLSFKELCSICKHTTDNAPVSPLSSSKLSSTDRKGSRIRSRSRSKSGAHSGNRSTSATPIAPLIYYGTFGCLICYAAVALDRTVSFMAEDTLGWLPFHYYCQWSIPVATDVYVLAKSCMYLIFVARLHQGFKDSMYAVNERLLIALYAALGLKTVSSCVVILLFARGKFVDVSHSMRFCELRIPKASILYASVFELVFVSYVVYRFVSTLSKINRDLTRNRDERSQQSFRQENADMLLLPLKYTILSVVAVVTTVASNLFLGVFDIHVLGAFDCALNCATLVLMTGPWTPVYNWLCSPLLRCIAHTPWLPCTHLTEEQLSALVRTTIDIKVKTKYSKESSSGKVPAIGSASDSHPQSQSQDSKPSKLPLEISI